MSEVFEIREFLDQNNRPVKSEVIDVFGEYDSLRKVLHESKEQINYGHNKKPDDIDDEEEQWIKVQNEKTKKNQLIESLCERLNPESIESRPDGDEERVLVRELEKFSRMSLDKPVIDQDLLRKDLNFFDDLEKLEYEDDRKSAAIRIRQREKQLEDEYNRAAITNRNVNSKKTNTSSSTSSSSSGWKKGFLSSSVTSATAVAEAKISIHPKPNVQDSASTELLPSVIEVAPVTVNDTIESSKNSVIQHSETFPAPVKPKQAAVSKPRPILDKVMERFP